MSQAIIDALFTKLTTDQTSGSLYDSVTGRIYDGTVPDNAGNPSLVYNLIDDPPQLVFGARDTIRIRIQFDVYVPRESGTKAARQINDKLYSLLHRSSLTVTGYTGNNVLCQQRGAVEVEDDFYRIRSEYLVFGIETA